MQRIRKLQQVGQYLMEFCKCHSAWIIVVLCALLFDTISTIHFMNDIGIQEEIHPIVRISALTFGPVIGTVLAGFIYKAAVVVFLAAYLKQLRTYVFMGPTITATLAGLFNFFVP